MAWAMLASRPRCHPGYRTVAEHLTKHGITTFGGTVIRAFCHVSFANTPSGAISRCDPFITMVETAEFRDFDDRSMVHDLPAREGPLLQVCWSKRKQSGD